MTESAEEVPIQPRVFNDPHKQEPPQAAEQGAEDIYRDAELSLIHAMVGSREGPGGPVAQGTHEDRQHASGERARPEVAVLGDVEVVRRHGPDLREDVGRHHEEGDEHGADHQDPEDGRVDEVHEDLGQEVRDRLGRVACPLPRGEGLHVGPPGDPRLSRAAGCGNLFGLVLPCLLRPVGACLYILRRVCGPGRCCRADVLGLWQQEYRGQEPDDVEGQLSHEEVLVPVVLEHDAADYGDH